MGEDADDAAIAAFIAKWKESGGSERPTFQSFIGELCDRLGVAKPNVGQHNRDYVLERDVTFRHPDGSTSPGRIDLNKRSCFVLEAKQGVGQEAPSLLPVVAGTRKRSGVVRDKPCWDALMMRARGQAEAYAKALPDDAGWPPFLVVCDVGHCFELFADFWPVELTEQVLSVRRVLEGEGRPVDVAAVARRCQRAPKARIESTLATLAALGHVRALADGRFASVR